MSIIINIDVMLAKRKMSVTELSEKVGITISNISILKNGKAKAIRLSTLDARFSLGTMHLLSFSQRKKLQKKGILFSFRLGEFLGKRMRGEKKKSSLDR